MFHEVFQHNLLDLVMDGFTVVPPEKMGASDLTPRLRDAILEVYERRSGHSIPLPPQPLLCKCIYALTDFDREHGTTAFVPGSHKWGRNPVGNETVIGEQAIPVEAPAGSLIIFHGSTWHGAYNRVAQGLRASVHLLMVRSILRVTEDFYDFFTRGPRRAILHQESPAPSSVL